MTTRTAALPLLAAAGLCRAETAPPGGPEDAGWRRIGTVKPRHAREIRASNWSVGAETMDRGFTLYRRWRQHLRPLGAKKARIQAGWAKTEKEPGRYDWAWLDEIIPDMAAQGVEPWVCLCYGNPLYGGGTGLGSNPPTDPRALDAWCRFVDAFVARYQGQVDEWEIWNEPRGGAKIAPDYAAFLIRTAEAVRRRQPRAVIIGCASAGIDLGLIGGTLEALKQAGKLDLLDQVSYHPYNPNPDRSYAQVAKLRALIAGYSGRIGILQGENGAPSQRGSYGALADYDWSEERQAKWALRRLLGDLGRDIPSSYFSICDMHYESRVNYKGLLATNPDKSVHHAKTAYGAVQRVTAIFDDRLKRSADFAWETPDAALKAALTLFGYEDGEGRQVITLWRSDAPPSDTRYANVDLVLPQGRFVDPVYVDLLTGNVYEIPAASRRAEGGGVAFLGVPVYDSAVLIAERSLIPIEARL